MTFKVELSPHAEVDVEEAFAFIALDSKAHAQKWFREALQAFKSLKKMPYRNPLAPEAEELGFAIRQMPHYSHRIVYSVDPDSKTVSILRLYHMSRGPLRKSDLE